MKEDEIIYKITIINAGEETLLYYPTSDRNAPHVLKANLSEKAGQSDTLTFTVSKQNDAYDKIFDMVTNVKVEKFKNNAWNAIFEGRVFQGSENFSRQDGFYKDVTCEDELNYLNDTLTRSWTIANMSTLDFITKVINNHNSHTTADKQFSVGNIEVLGTINCTTDFENSLNCLIDKMVNTLGVGYLAVRKENGIRYLDYLPQLNGTSDHIILGKNMVDLAFNKDMTNRASRIVPSGQNNLTIESVNNGLDYLEDANAVAEFGVIEQRVQFSDITDANILKTKAQAELPNITKPIYKLSSNVLDLSTIGKNPDGFIIGTDTNIICNPISFNQNFTIIQKDVDLLNPKDTKLTFDNKFESLPDRQIALQRVAEYVNKILTADKQVNTFYLDGYINLLKNQVKASGAYQNAQYIENKGILLENTDETSEDYGALYLGPGIFTIADSKDESGNWNWRTFGTGKGFIADLIIAGKILGGAVEFDLNAGTLKISHSDDTYSIFSADGVKRYINGVLYDYSCLTYTGVSVISDSENSIVIQLPDEFKGRHFKATAQAASLQNLTTGYALKTYEAIVDDTKYDYDNARFTINGTCVATWIAAPTEANERKIDFQISYIVIGG